MEPKETVASAAERRSARRREMSRMRGTGRASGRANRAVTHCCSDPVLRFMHKQLLLAM